MDRRNLLRTLLMRGEQDSAMEGLTWKRYVLSVAALAIMLGLVLLATNYSHLSMRLTSISFIFIGLAGFDVVLTSIVATRYYRTWQIVAGAIVALVLFLAGFAFFVMSFQH